MSSERRIHERTANDSPVVVFSGGSPSLGRLLDLSQGGASLLSEKGLDVGESCELLLQLSHNRLKRVQGVVVRNRSGHLGVEFAKAQPSLAA